MTLWPFWRTWPVLIALYTLSSECRNWLGQVDRSVVVRTTVKDSNLRRHELVQNEIRLARYGKDGNGNEATENGRQGSLGCALTAHVVPMTRAALYAPRTSAQGYWAAVGARIEGERSNDFHALDFYRAIEGTQSPVTLFSFRERNS